MRRLFRPCFGGVSASLLLAMSGCGSEERKDPLAGLTIVSDDPSDVAIAELSPMWRDRFAEGDVLFDKAFLDNEGLGPVFIRQACASCHSGDSRGPGAVRKMVIVGEDGAPIPDQASALPFGHTVRPQVGGAAQEGIDVPARDDVLVTTRMPPAVFGRGYLEAIEDSEIERIADEQAARGDEITGRVSYVTYTSEHNPDERFHSHQPGETLVGRFGLKARVATLDDFTADALQGDMGITSPMRPDELPNPASEDDELVGVDVDVDLVNKVADYMRLLRIPTRDEAAQSERGAELFEKTGCDSCHVPMLRTRKDHPIAQLADVDAEVYTDVLLHDMGPSFSDGLSDFDAGPSEWRTAPLLGLRHMKNYLHDGRAKSIEDAITLHGGEGSEAARSVKQFSKLSVADRAELVKFVSTL